MQGVSVGTIRTKANVCSVQFPVDSGNSLAFGSADHRIYYYDLRNPIRPVSVFVGHEKTVSYVKFVDSTTLVSSSTDNTLKLWDLSECSSHVVDCPVQSFTGHTNVKVNVFLSSCFSQLLTVYSFFRFKSCFVIFCRILSVYLYPTVTLPLVQKRTR